MIAIPLDCPYCGARLHDSDPLAACTAHNERLLDEIAHLQTDNERLREESVKWAEEVADLREDNERLAANADRLASALERTVFDGPAATRKQIEAALTAHKRERAALAAHKEGGK